jgi:hypothetical protein
MQDQLRARAALVRASGMFAASEYALRGEALLRNQDPVEHYLLHGEARGARPSSLFDPVYYAIKNGISEDSPLIHYLLIGRKQGLRPRLVVEDFLWQENGFRKGYTQVLLLVDSDARALLNSPAADWIRDVRADIDIAVVCLSAREGAYNPTVELAASAVPQRSLSIDWLRDAKDRVSLVDWLLKCGQPAAAIAYGAAAERLLPLFANSFLATVTLLDSSSGNPERLAATLGCTSCYVFSGKDTKSQYIERVPSIRSRLLFSPEENEDAQGRNRFDSRLILAAVNSARAQALRIASDFDVLSRRGDLVESIQAQFGAHAQGQSRIKQNLLSRGRDTGSGPIEPCPRLFLSQQAASEFLQQAGNDDPVLLQVLRNLSGQVVVKRTITRTPGISPAAAVRVAIHGHYYYPELLNELLELLSRNATKASLFLSTDTTKKRDELLTLAASRDASPEVRVFPNRGRDVAPLFTGFRDLFEENRFDFICHVHSKKSARIGTDRGDKWRKELLNRTIGGEYGMMDIIIQQMANDRDIGLVFPAISNFCAWDANFSIGKELAARMALAADLTKPFFEYPAGMMFWCRPVALRPLVDLGLDWQDYPPEPIPDDGTIAHAIERLIPFICKSQGFEYCTVGIR